jgi:hypothetical protein
MSFTIQNVQIKNSVEEALYTLKCATGGTTFNGLLSASSTGPVAFTALNTNDNEDFPTSTSTLNLLCGSTLSESTGAYISYANFSNTGDPQTQIYTPGSLSLQSGNNQVIVTGSLDSDYLNVTNSLSLGEYPNNGSITYDERSLLQASSVIPTSTFDPTSLTIDQTNGFIWTVDYTSKILYKINSSNNTVFSQTSLSDFTIPIDLTWSSRSNSVWVITNEGPTANQSSLIRINCDTGGILSSWSLNSLIGNGHANTIIHDNSGYLWLMMGSYTTRRVYKIDIVTDPSNPVSVANVSINEGGLIGGYYMDASDAYLYAITNVGFGSPSVLIKIRLNSPYTVTTKTLSFSGTEYYPANGFVYDTNNEYLWIAVSHLYNSSNQGYDCVIALDSTDDLVQAIPLPNHPNDITIGGDAIWTANADNTMSKIDIQTFTVSAVLQVGYLSTFILWSNYDNVVWIASRRDSSSNGNLDVVRPLPVVNHSGMGRIITSDNYGNFINAESNLTFENATKKLTISQPQVVEDGDVIGQYISKASATGPTLMNTAMINFVSDYTDASTDCVGGLIDFRTRGNTDNDNSNLESNGYSRVTIANNGEITFNTSNGSTGYIFPQTKPTDGQILSASGSDGNLTWQSGVWQTYSPIITSDTAISSSVSYSKYTVIGKTCMGTVVCNISNVVSPTGASNSINFTLPLPGTSNSIVVGSGILTINSSASYPSQSVTLIPKISDYNSGAEGPAICRLWYSANNGTTTDRQTYLENDYLPTPFGATVTWNGYSGGVDISFNFTYEI